MSSENTELQKSGVSTNHHSALSVALVGDDEAGRKALRGALGEISELKLDVTEASAPPLSRKLGAATAQLLMVMLGANPEKWAAEVHAWLNGGARPVVIGVVSNRSPDTVRRALRAGAEEVILLPIDRDELARCLVKIIETHPNVSGCHRNVTCSLVSVAGGVGVSWLTAGLGFAIHRLGRKRVALLDLGLQCSALSALLDIDPQHTIADLASGNTAIDSIRLESVLSKHASGLSLLAAPTHIEEGELISANTISSVLQTMRELFDFVMVDCGHHLTESTVAAWQQSDYLLYLIDQSVTSIRPAQRFLDLFERLRLRGVRLEFVLNRFDPRHRISLERIETALQRPIFARVARDDAAFSGAEVAGQDISIAAPGSVATEAIEDLTRRLVGLEAIAHKGQGLFARLFSTPRA